MSPHLISRVTILGTGLIGGSFALALLKYATGLHISGWDRPEIVNQARSRNAIDEAFTGDLAPALRATDLVYIDPPGTGFSEAISPATNGDFWSVDSDARIFEGFIQRYLTVNKRNVSPLYLYGESYGTPRTCVLSWMLHEDGVDLNGVVLQSSILDYSPPQD